MTREPNSLSPGPDRPDKWRVANGAKSELAQKQPHELVPNGLVVRGEFGPEP